MHTEENQSKGKQVANNRIEHYEIVLTETPSGEYRFDIDQLPSVQVIRGEYWAVGNRMHFPKSWGKERGARHMYSQLLEDAERGFKSAQERLDKIKALGELIDGANWTGID